jgi:deoxyribodipyrimidine photo-lyase
VAGGPAADVAKLRDELLWQEYARHLYARLGHRTARALRFAPARAAESWPDPWPREMACVDLTVGELERDGWLVNQTRMWLASQWTVRAGHEWTAGEDRFFVHLLDGSRAANRLGWQWAVGAGTGKPYGFSRRQVRKRAPGLCETCALREACPIEDWPEARAGARLEPPAALRRDPDPAASGGPEAAVRAGGAAPEAVWLTAESLGDADPALAARPGLPAVFVFDAPLLARWRLSGKRLVFLAETLGDLALRRPVEVHRGAPAEVLAGRPLAATFAPVPGFRARAARLQVAELHPWPWLVRPHGGPAGSFSAWRKAARR